MARHYLTVHEDESEVVRFIDLPLGKERKKQLERLRLMGNYYHNLKVLDKKSGQLIVVRRPTKHETCDHSDFLPCPNCLGFFRKKELWKHSKICLFKQSSENEKKDAEGEGFTRIQEQSKILLWSDLTGGDNKELIRVFSSMRSDEITLVARNDDLIRKYGSFLTDRIGQARRHEISQGMRRLARLLLQLNRNKSHSGKEQTLQDYMRPDLFDAIVCATKELCSFDKSKTKEIVGIPSLGLKLGHQLKKCLYIQRGQALRKKDNASLQDIENLSKLIETEWNDKISYHALDTLSRRKFNKLELLPLTQDLTKLRESLLHKIKHLTDCVKKNPTLDEWGQLSEAVLCRMIIFNKRRGGETSKMLLEAFTKRPQWESQTLEVITSTLQPLEKQLMKRLDMVEIRGKRGRKVAVILTPDMKEAIDVLVEKRQRVGINNNNRYLFARASAASLTYIRGWDCLKKHACDANLQLEKPELITSTRLRKYIATVSQVLDLDERELGWLARHMGHNIDIHKEYYRLHDSTIELAKISKILTAVDQGAMGEGFSGKTIGDLEIDMFEGEAGK